MIWSAVAVAAFCFGYILTGQPRSTNEPPSSSRLPSGQKPESKPAPSAENEQWRPLAQRWRTHGENVPVDSVRAEAFQILSESDRIQRIGAFCELLHQLTPENCGEVLKAISDQIAQGRVLKIESQMFFERLGEVLAGDALTGDLAPGRTVDTGRTAWIITGWARKNSAAAAEWFRALPKEQQAQYIPALLNGLGTSDPKLGLTLLEKVDHSLRERAMPGLLDGAAQAGGLKAVEDLYVDLRNRPGIEELMKGKLFYELATRRAVVAAAAGDRSGGFEWLDQYLTAAGPAALKDVIRTLNANDPDPASTLTWFDERAAKINPTQSQSIYSAIGQLWAQQPVEAVLTWVASHPEHPQRDIILQPSATKLLAKGDFQEARRVIGLMKPSELQEGLLEAARDGEAIAGRPAAR